MILFKKNVNVIFDRAVRRKRHNIFLLASRLSRSSRSPRSPLWRQWPLSPITWWKNERKHGRSTCFWTTANRTWQNVNIMAAMKWVEGTVSCILMRGLYVMVLFMMIGNIRNGDTYQRVDKDCTVVIAFLVRNKAHTLPYFLTLLERLDYPKDRISLW